MMYIKLEENSTRLWSAKYQLDESDTPSEWIEVEEHPDDLFMLCCDYFYEDGKFIKDEESESRREEEYKSMAKITELKELLDSTDYIIIKIAEGVATVEEYADIICQRAEWRRDINRLRGQL